VTTWPRPARPTRKLADNQGEKTMEDIVTDKLTDAYILREQIQQQLDIYTCSLDQANAEINRLEALAGADDPFSYAA
tara:strand:+ start:656 stop:886 length:231 start_codon:yes stop_codon:yes gene_type:complete